MKKWSLTILAALALVALALTVHTWVPWVTGLAHKNKDELESFNTLAELVSKLVAWPAAFLVFFYRLWREKKDKDARPALPVAIQNARAGRDQIAAGGDVQTGGVKIVYQQAPAQPAATTLHQLSPPPADFTGRETELAELRTAMATGGVHISGLQGQGGVGKTALALKLAAELAPSYPDAQIYLDLRGVSEKPLTPSEALAYVIRAFHPEAKLPEGEAELGATYQSVLHGKRALLLMDNARDAAQVRLLSPPAGCAFLVTSRHHFVLPGLHPRNLDTLPPSDAKALLLAVAPRIDGEAETISRLCGYLPLALRLAATALAESPGLAPAEYARRLADEKGRLKLLQAGDQSVEASIGCGYSLLDADGQKRWRMLGVFPDTFDAPAAAAIWTVGARLAAPENALLATPQDALSRLAQYSMLEWNETTRRYRLHDLMRDFARTKSEPAEREAAARRHAAYYADVLASADGLYLKGGEAIKQGLALFDLEWRNIQAGQAWAAAHAPEDTEATNLCSRYPSAGTYCLALRQHAGQQVVWRRAARKAARSLKDPDAEAEHLCGLGVAYYHLGDFDRTIEFQRQALKINRKVRNGLALGSLGMAYDALGEYRRAADYHNQHLAIARELDDRRGQGYALGNLGLAYAGLREYRRAINYHKKALVIARQTKDRVTEGRELGNLGIAYHSLGDTRRAIEYYEQHLAIAREIGDLRGEGAALWNMSLTLDKPGERAQAIQHAEAALKIFEQIKDANAARVRAQLQQWKP